MNPVLLVCPMLAKLEKFLYIFMRLESSSFILFQSFITSSTVSICSTCSLEFWSRAIDCALLTAFLI